VLKEIVIDHHCSIISEPVAEILNDLFVIRDEEVLPLQTDEKSLVKYIVFDNDNIMKKSMLNLFECSILARDMSRLPMTDHETHLFGQLAYKAFRFNSQKKLVLPNVKHYPSIELVRVPTSRSIRNPTRVNLQRRDCEQLALAKHWIGHLPLHLSEQLMVSFFLEHTQLARDLIGMHL